MAFQRKTLLVLAALGLLPAMAGAQIYKCEQDDGTLAYSQTPCPDKPSTQIDAGNSSDSEVDCRLANRFAFRAARYMHGGLSSDQLFTQYGGLDSLSKGTLGLINYVYTFRTNSDVSAERIASLTEAKCEAGSLGDVSCDALPLSYTEPLGGCDPETGALAEADPDEAPVSTFSETVPAVESGEAATSRPRSGGADEQVSARRAACEKSTRDRIDAIDAAMRRGYDSEQGERYREQLRELTRQLRECKSM
ncbi:MAG: DUF4124 domain-containing protein [Woeseiaceae bacterium]|nr:DUF4124 domain-containing protein [Woeseiaceae bacterium]